MAPDMVAAKADELGDLCCWSARKVRPVVLLYVAAVFVGFMMLGHFVFHSNEAVKALAMAAVGALVPLVPMVRQRVEYRLTDRGLDHRPYDEKRSREFTKVFELDDLSHVVPTRRGFKYSKPLNESKPLVRFWKAHISDAYSGEVHVEKADLARVLELLARRGVSIR